jgi:hypothetical protein
MNSAKQAPRIVECSVETTATRADVFLFMVPQRMPYWYGAEMSSEFEVSGGCAEFSVAQKVRITGKIARKEVAHTAVVTRFEWPKIFEWRFEDAYGVRGIERWEVEPTATGARVTMRSEYAIPGKIGRAVDWLVTRHAVARRNGEYLARLKKYAERR